MFGHKEVEQVAVESEMRELIKSGDEIILQQQFPNAKTFLNLLSMNPNTGPIKSISRV